MISKVTLIRPGMTAIAAVIALSSTPLFAQDTAPQAASPGAVPAQVTPPTVVPTAPSTSVPTMVTPPAATTVAPQPATPVIELAPPAPVPVEATPPAAVSASERPARTASPRAETPRPAVSQRSAAPAPAAPAEAQPAAPPVAVEAMQVPAPVPLAVEAAPVEETAPPATATVASNDTLPLVGAGALAVLALGAAGFALSRRRRRGDVFADETVEAEPMMAEPVAPSAPAFARETAPVPASAAVAASAAATMPNGFDISRYGRHVQAAYRGPTPDNPFVSLKKRLTRAHFYDMQEARAAGAAATPQTEATAAQPARDRFEVRHPAAAPARPSMRPAFQY